VPPSASVRGLSSLAAGAAAAPGGTGSSWAACRPAKSAIWGDREPVRMYTADRQGAVTRWVCCRSLFQESQRARAHRAQAVARQRLALERLLVHADVVALARRNPPVAPLAVVEREALLRRLENAPAASPRRARKAILLPRQEKESRTG